MAPAPVPQSCCMSRASTGPSANPREHTGRGAHSPPTRCLMPYGLAGAACVLLILMPSPRAARPGPSQCSDSKGTCATSTGRPRTPPESHLLSPPCAGGLQARATERRGPGARGTAARRPADGQAAGPRQEQGQPGCKGHAGVPLRDVGEQGSPPPGHSPASGGSPEINV